LRLAWVRLETSALAWACAVDFQLWDIALANGNRRFSGWRYDLPADWVAILFWNRRCGIISAIALLLAHPLTIFISKIELKQSNAKLNLQFALPVLVVYINRLIAVDRGTCGCRRIIYAS